MWRAALATILFASASLAGCAGGAKAPETFDLLAPRISTLTAPRPASFQLVVNEPIGVRALETDRILVKPGPERVTYYKGAAWSDRLPRLLQVRMVEAFQNAGLVKAVGSRGDRLDADMELATQVTSFQVEVEQGGASAVIRVYLKLIDGQRGKMIDSRGFESRVPTSASDAAEMVASLNKAFDNVLRDVVPWVAKARKKTT